MAKKIVLWVSLTVNIYYLCMFLLSKFDFFNLHNWANILLVLFDIIGINFILFPIIFILSLITYKLSDEIFKSWLKFSIYYLIPDIVFNYAITFYFSDINYRYSGLGSALASAYVFFAILLLVSIYLLISIIIIIKKYLEIKKLKNIKLI